MIEPFGYPLTVIVPTFNRRDVLISCLKHLEQQTHKDFEVIVVDDGSTDETAQAMHEYMGNTPLNLRFLQQRNGGPARARNVAITEARSPLVLMIGDDIFATPELVEFHLNLHRRYVDPRVAGLGLTQWEETKQHVTPFMKFLDGVQFAYGDLLLGKAPGWQHFYTSNLSVKTEVLRRNLFDERFLDAAYEDLELGLRIAKNEGLKLLFLPDALAYHFHPTTLPQACRRMRKVGSAMHLFHELWPDMRSDPAGRTSLRRMLRRAVASTPLLSVATAISALLVRFCCPKGLLQPILNTHLYVGYTERETANPDACGSDERDMNPQRNF
jgi:glycosyltransferase involved in cell wall biosynthesis